MSIHDTAHIPEYNQYDADVIDAGVNDWIKGILNVCRQYL